MNTEKNVVKVSVLELVEILKTVEKSTGRKFPDVVDIIFIIVIVVLSVIAIISFKNKKSYQV